MAKSQSLVMAGRNCDDSVQMLLFHDMFVTVCYASVFCQLAFWLDMVSFHVIICWSNAALSSVSPPHSRISDCKYLRFAIGASPMFFRADSVTLNTPHTTGKSDKIIFRSTKIIGTLLSEGEKSAQNQPDYLLVCTSIKISRFFLVSSVHWRRLALNGSFESVICRFENSCNRIFPIRGWIVCWDLRTDWTGSLKRISLFMNQTPLLRLRTICFIKWSEVKSTILCFGM